MGDEEKTKDQLIRELRELRAQAAGQGELRALSRHSESDLLRLAAIVESSDDAIIGKSLEGTIFAWNSGAEKVYGYSADEVIGESISMLVPPDRSHEVAMILDRIGRGERVAPFETLRVRKNGERFFVSLTVSPIKDPAGTIIGVSAIAHDITARKRAEEALRQSEETVRGLLNAPTDMALLLILGRDGSILTLNEAAARSLGGNEGEFIGKCIYCLLPPEEAEIRKEAVESVFRTGTPRRIEEDWQDRALDLSVYPVFDTDGKVERVAIFASDVTEHRRVQKETVRQSEFLQQVIESLTHPFYVIDANTYEVKLANSAAAPAGLSPGTACYVLTHQSSELCQSPDHACPLQIIKKTHKPVTITHVHTDESGKRKYIEVHGYPVFSPTGEVAQVIEYSLDVTERREMEETVCNARDELEVRVNERTAELARAYEQLRLEVEERKRAEAAVEAERQRLFAVLEVIPAFVYLQAPDHSIRYANRQFRDLFGDPDGRLCHEVIHGRKKSCDVCPTFKVFETGQPSSWEWDGLAGRVYQVYDTPFSDVDGSPLALEMGIDITEHKRLERELKEYTERLERSHQELEEFTFVASHDLQEPLRKIQVFSSRIHDHFPEGGDAALRDWLERMQRSVKQMRELVQALLDYSHITARAEPPKSVNMGEVVERVIADMDGLTEEVEVQVEMGEIQRIKADRKQMYQLFHHLIGNAVKFRRNEEKPRIRIRGSVEDGAYVIDMEDNGVGFDEKYLDKIFRPFQRLHGWGGYEGTGMGLTICRKIVEHHKGSITARSRPGEGTTFIIRLPLRPPD